MMAIGNWLKGNWYLIALVIFAFGVAIHKGQWDGFLVGFACGIVLVSRISDYERGVS